MHCFSSVERLRQYSTVEASSTALWGHLPHCRGVYRTVEACLFHPLSRLLPPATICFDHALDYLRICARFLFFSSVFFFAFVPGFFPSVCRLFDTLSVALPEASTTSSTSSTSYWPGRVSRWRGRGSRLSPRCVVHEQNIISHTWYQVTRSTKM